MGRFIGEEEIPSCSGTCVRAGEVQGVTVDVKHHAAFSTSHGGVLVRANVIEQLDEGIGSALG